MTKSNGHDKEATETHVENPGSARMRRSRERRRQGIVLLKKIEIGPDLTSALVEFGWLHESQRQDEGAVSDAIGALTYASLNAGIKPIQTGKALVPVALEAIQEAAGWLKPGTPITAETAGQALSIVARCAATVNFGPSTYASHLMRLMAEREARSVVVPQTKTH